MYLPALQRSTTSQVAHMPASEAQVVEQSLCHQTLALATIRYRGEQQTETPFLRRTVLLLCFVAIFFRATQDTLLQLLVFHYILSNHDVNRQVDDTDKETIVQAS